LIAFSWLHRNGS